jgi:hypothetical protein
MSNRNDNIEMLANQIEKKIISQTGNRDLEDDITCVCLEHKGGQ